MSALSIQPTYPIFTDIDGQPLEDGYVWIGTANLDPQTNPINVYWDAALTLHASQPIRTLAGYPVNSGTPARLYVNSDYSIRVMNKNGSAVYSAPAATERYSYVVVSGVNAEDVIYDPPFIGGVQTNVEAKLAQTVSVKDFGAVGDGVTDDTAAIQAAIDYASSVITDESGDVDQVTAAVKFPAGKYRTTSAIQIKNCVQLHGDGSGATWVLVDHAGNGFYTASGSYYANIQVYGMHLESGGSAQDGFVVDGQIRNCYYHDVGCRGFRYSFNVTNSWTVVFDQCYSYSCEHHFYCVTDVGGVHIYHGRYDVASNHGIYVDSAAAELVVHDAAVQFGSKSAVYVKNCYTVELDQCFFEGNCIGSTTDYYVYINRDTVYSLTSAAVRNCVFNNLSDSNRDGLGILYIENIVGFDYVARWARNNVSVVPIVGANVSRINIEYNGANSRSSALTNIGVGSNANAVVSQVARPYGIYGQDMADTSFAPTTRAALNVGFEDIGVAVGTYNSHPSLQGYGDSNKLYLNPADGSILLGQTGLASMDDGTNEFSGRFKEITQATSSNITPNATTGLVSVDCSGGSRTITLTNLLGAYGRHLYVVKSDGGSNTLTVTAAAGETINGSASWSSASAYAAVHLIGTGSGWVII